MLKEPTRSPICAVFSRRDPGTLNNVGEMNALIRKKHRKHSPRLNR
jgi:hypothetical protein